MNTEYHNTLAPDEKHKEQHILLRCDDCVGRLPHARCVTTSTRPPATPDPQSSARWRLQS